MKTLIQTIKCTNVLAQVNLGFYDEEGNLVAEESFPQTNGNAGAARLFHPHEERLASLIEFCVQQAWEQLQAGSQLSAPSSQLPAASSQPDSRAPGAGSWEPVVSGPNGNGVEQRPTMNEVS